MNNYLSSHFPGNDATTRNRIVFLTTLAKRFPKIKDFSFLNHTQEVMEEVHADTDNIDTKWNRMMFIVKALKAEPSLITPETKEFYDTIISQAKIDRDTKRDNNVKTPKQQITLKTELTQRQDQLTHKITQLFTQYQLPYDIPTDGQFKFIDVFKFGKALQDLMIPAVYLYQPALRSDWGGLRITGKITGLSTDNNWLYVRGSTMKIIMNVYKNAKSMGHQVIVVRPQLVKLMQIWIAVLKKMLGSSPKYPLYYKIIKDKCDFVKSDEALRRNISRITERVFGIGLSINTFRHLWEISIQTDPSYAKLNQDARHKIHAELLHSTPMAQLYNIH